VAVRIVKHNHDLFRFMRFRQTLRRWLYKQSPASATLKRDCPNNINVSNIIS
jgi:hypothetical protein